MRCAMHLWLLSSLVPRPLSPQRLSLAVLLWRSTASEKRWGERSGLGTTLASKCARSLAAHGTTVASVYEKFC